MNATLGQLSITRMTQDEAETIADWHYKQPCDFYDARADASDLVELLSPGGRSDTCFAAHDEAGELIGSFVFKPRGDSVLVGLGLRPDLTGRGFGLSFLEQGLDFARDRFAANRFSLTVAEFNARAIALYERAGFERTRAFVHETNGGSHPFLEMERSA